MFNPHLLCFNPNCFTKQFGQQHHQEAVIGAAVGTSVAGALGIALGLGLGLAPALAAVFVANGHLQRVGWDVYTKSWDVLEENKLL